MSSLNTNSTPAERMRGITFAELFKDDASVLENGGVVNGAEVCDGATLDNSDYIQYDLTEQSFKTDEISIVIEMYPDFDPEDSQTHYIFDNDADTGRCRLFKTTSNFFQFYLGDTPLFSTGSIDNFKQGERTTIVISGTSGDTTMWINGVEAATSAVAWSPGDVSELYVGANIALNSFANGKYTEFKIFNSLLTEEEAIDFYNGTTYSYMDDAVVNLPMTACEHDPSNTLQRTLDISGNDNHAILGDGTTVTTIPSKLQKRGYDFNASNEYINLGNGNDVEFTDGDGNDTAFTIAQVFTTKELGTEQVLFGKRDIPNDSIYRIYISKDNAITIQVFGDSTSERIGRNTDDNLIKTGALNVLHVCYDGSESSDGISIYLNGHRVDTSNNNAGVYTGMKASDVDTAIGISFNGAGYLGDFNGDINNFEIWKDECLTPIQVKDSYINLMANINKV